jgi:hypothetical protein
MITQPHDVIVSSCHREAERSHPSGCGAVVIDLMGTFSVLSRPRTISDKTGYGKLRQTILAQIPLRLVIYINLHAWLGAMCFMPRRGGKLVAFGENLGIMEHVVSMGPCSLG